MAEYALRSSLFGNGDALHANWWTAVILSAGKLGALLAGFVMQVSCIQHSVECFWCETVFYAS